MRIAALVISIPLSLPRFVAADIICDHVLSVLRFVWGRSRLPASDQAFREPFRIECREPTGGLSVDTMLPVGMSASISHSITHSHSRVRACEGHTCSFLLELP